MEAVCSGSLTESVKYASVHAWICGMEGKAFPLGLLRAALPIRAGRKCPRNAPHLPPRPAPSQETTVPLRLPGPPRLSHRLTAQRLASNPLTTAMPHNRFPCGKGSAQPPQGRLSPRPGASLPPPFRKCAPAETTDCLCIPPCENHLAPCSYEDSVAPCRSSGSFAEG